MWTDARPVRVESRLPRKSSTAFSMRFFSWLYVSLNAGLFAITDAAISVHLTSSVEKRNYKWKLAFERKRVTYELAGKKGGSLAAPRNSPAERISSLSKAG